MYRCVFRRMVCTALIWFVFGSYVMAQTGGFDPLAQRRGTSSSRNVISNVEFVDTEVTTVFRMISDVTGSSIILSPDVSKQPPKINLWIKNLTPQEVLEKVVALAGLVADNNENTVMVMTFDEYTQLHGVEKRVVRLEYANATDVVKLLQPYVDKQAQSRIVPYDDGQAVVLLVPAPLLNSLVRLVEAVDVPRRYDADRIRVIQIKHADAELLGPRLKNFFTESTSSMNFSSRGFTGTDALQRKGDDNTNAVAGEAYTLRVMVEPPLNVLVLRGLASDVEQAATLIEKLDVPQDIKVIGYTLRYTAAAEVYETLQELIQNESSSTSYTQDLIGAVRLRIALSQQNNQIIVEGSSADHQRVSKMIESIDRAMVAGNGGIRVYRLENSSAEEVTKILQALIDAREEANTATESGTGGGLQSAENGIRRVQTQAASTPQAAAPQTSGIAGDGGGLTAGDLEGPTVVSAPEINSIVIRASASEHEEFSAVIKDLDKPRSQVVLEMTLVSVSSTDLFELGIEMAGSATANDGRVGMVSLSSFGVGTQTTTGEASLNATIPSGLNFALFNSNDFALVLNALQTVGDTEIVSSPKILVEDNSTASIRQTGQEPFEVSHDNGDTITTSFGGFVDAGTTLTITPHISEKDWLRLIYNVALSSFGERTSTTSPPARQESVLEGIVRVPAGYTVVLGGLVGSQKTDLADKVPFLGEIPLIGRFFSHQARDDVKETLFVFVRPTILRDEGFEDLIRLSSTDLESINHIYRDWPENSLMQFPEPDKE